MTLTLHDGVVKDKHNISFDRDFCTLAMAEDCLVGVSAVRDMIVSERFMIVWVR